jgi:putative PIN family toxin of toxin-antitoxin system
MRGSERAVLDTNVVLSALIFPGENTTRIRDAWRSGRITPLASRVTAAELMRALAYPKFALSASEQEHLLADYLPWCEVVEIPVPPPAVPRCRDPHDRPFLELAVAGRATLIISGDKDLLALRAKARYSIVTPAEFVARP